MGGGSRSFTENLPPLWEKVGKKHCKVFRVKGSLKFMRGVA
jgi:hypothetical protein